MQFYPVFRATLYNNSTGEHPATEQYIELAYPNTSEIPLTGEAPCDLDGHLCFREPPVYPCIITTEKRHNPLIRFTMYHVPNRTLHTPADWDVYKAEFGASPPWTYHHTREGTDLYVDPEDAYAESRRARHAAVKAAGRYSQVTTDE